MRSRAELTSEDRGCRKGGSPETSRVLRADAARRRWRATTDRSRPEWGSRRLLRRGASLLSRLFVGFALAVNSGPVEAEEAVAIAILPIVVHSAEPPEYLREGLADMLVSRLEQVSQFEVIRIDDTSKATTSLSTALQTARGRGADFVLFGSFTRFGQGASLDMQCAAADPTALGKPLREIFVYSGSIGDVIPDLDELVGKVSRFAIADFTDSDSVSAGSKSESVANRRLVDDLRRRVEALESSVRRLFEELKDRKSSSAEE